MLELNAVFGDDFRVWFFTLGTEDEGGYVGFYFFVDSHGVEFPFEGNSVSFNFSKARELFHQEFG